MAQRLAVLLQIAVVVGVLQMPLLLPLLSMPHASAWAPVIGLGMCATTLMLYGASYRRMMRLALEGTGASTARRPILQRLVRLAASITAFSPPARGVCAFALRTVVRSRHHRMILAGWVGLAVAIVASTVLPIVVRAGWNRARDPATDAAGCAARLHRPDPRRDANAVCDPVGDPCQLDGQIAAIDSHSTGAGRRGLPRCWHVRSRRCSSRGSPRPSCGD